MHDLALDHEDRVRFRLDSATTDRVTVGRMAYGVPAHIAGPAMRDCYHVNLLVSGHCTAVQSDRSASFSADQKNSGVVFGPEAPVLIDWSGDCAQYHLKLTRSIFEEHAARLAGHSTSSAIDFDLTFPLDSAAGRSLCSSVAFYYSQLATDGGLATMPAVQRELESALMTQVLLVARSNLTAELVRDVPRRPDTIIREVIDHIDRHAKDDLSIVMLAALFGTTARTLQAGFQREIGMTPSAYIRAVRLDGAHQDLCAGQGLSVSEIANRWHFFHLGRFAQQYRSRFGRTPSATLHPGSR
ncbi:putative AraC family transcriptional regulator [Gordonia rhizosphera NBRC 16068]|uniref:Putative AraC family transcriptional regulator n=1 Tax=Gordonia rhizosphera NBRC 16068 TaxID=1108045 RepID=K6VWG8_9ACTN|nr:putative AraC family transcriptional regulator [Gordonia rhizosphera NBRC 16068]